MNELEIRTPGNVSVSYGVASLFERSIAYCIDFFLVLFTIWVYSATLLTAFARLMDDDFMMLFLFSIVPILIYFGYFILVPYRFEGLTLGKYIFGLRVIRLDGLPMTFEAHAIRGGMLLIDALMSSHVLGLLMAGSSVQRQRIGDRIAQTTVVKAKGNGSYRLNDILSISTTDTHAVHFPNATDLSMDQALLIKELLVVSQRRSSKDITDALVATSSQVASMLEVPVPAERQHHFLQQVLRDYIVLTR